MYKLENDEMYNETWIKYQEKKIKDFDKHLLNLKKRNSVSTARQRKCDNELNLFEDYTIQTFDDYPFEEQQQILQTLLLLQEEDRLIFYLSTWQDYSMVELEKELNLTYETVRYRLNRAKKYLRENYNDKVKKIWRT